MIRLLIVDDESFVRNGIINNINWKELNIEYIEQADDGLNALNIALIFQPDIILSDIRMPNMNGIDFATNIRKTLPKCKLIFMSAFTEKEYFKSAISLSVISYVEKPIDLDELKGALKQAVDRHLEEAFINKSNSIAENTLLSNAEMVTLELIKVKHDSKLIGDALQQLNINHFLYGEYLIVLFKYKPLALISADEQSYISDRVDNVVVANDLTSTYAFKNNDILVMIVHSNSHAFSLYNHAFQVNLANSMLSSLNYSFDIFLAIGKPVNKIQNIYKSHQSAVISLQAFFIKGYGHYVIYNESHIQAPDYYEPKTDYFRQLLENEAKEAAYKYVSSLPKELIGTKNVLPSFLKDLYFKHLLIILNLSEKRNIVLFTYEKEDMLWDIFTQFDTLHSMEVYLIKKLELYFDTIEKSNSISKISTSIIKYIAMEYSNPDLTIKKIAQFMYMTDVYLCIVFKKEQGITINQYITEYRIERSKELMNNNNLNISEIAQRVGYKNQNYFTKVFKKISKCTPSDYKEKFLL